MENKPIVTPSKEWLFKFHQIVPMDLIMNFLSALLVTADVVTDLQTGLEHWENGNHLWAITTWSLMFVPATISLFLEILMTKCILSWEKSWKKILGHLPLLQFFYYLHILKNLKEAKTEMSEQIMFYSNLDFDNLPSDIKEQLKGKSQKYHDAKEKFSTTLSNLQEQKLFEGK